MAVSVLEETDQQVQEEGWYFNTDPNYTFSADAYTGEVRVPLNTARFKVYDYPGMAYRDGKIYDRHNSTFNIGHALTGALVQYLEFEALPEEAKAYIVARSARKLYTRIVGSQDSAQALAYEESQARANLQNYDCEEAGYSMLDDVTIPWINGSAYVPATPRNHPLY